MLYVGGLLFVCTSDVQPPEGTVHWGMETRPKGGRNKTAEGQSAVA